MELTAHVRYELEFRSGYVNPKGENGETSFGPPFNRRGTKLYVISSDGVPIYVGKATRPILERLGEGIRGENSYMWSRFLRESTLDLWAVTVMDHDIDAMKDDPSMKLAKGNKEKETDIILETIESEVAYCIRQAFGHWPRYQVEIHFLQSLDEHREKAQEIVSYYRKMECPTA